MQALANSTTDRYSNQLCNDINTFFHSVAPQINPLPNLLVLTEQVVPNRYIISISGVKRVMMKTDTMKLPVSDSRANWILHNLLV